MKTLATYIPGAGEHISLACTNAVEQAKKRGKNVSFRFNGVLMVASPKRIPRKMANAFHGILARDAKGPRDPQSVLAAREMDARIDKGARDARELTAILPDVLATGSLDTLIAWTKELVGCGDYRGIDYKPVAPLLAAAGYDAVEWHGHDPEWYCTRERAGNYIVCEVVSQIQDFGMPHPMVMDFCDQYFGIAE